jgi:hypothetical protein
MNPVENLVSRLHANRNGKGWIAKWPAHHDREPSLSINEGADGRALLKCHAGCDVDLICAALNIRVADLFPAKYPQPSRNGVTPNLAPSFDWRACVDAFTSKHLERLATWRGYSPEFCSWLKQNGFVGLYDGCIAFPVHNEAGHVVGAHYRLRGDDNHWRYYPKGVKTRPLVIGEFVAGDPIHVFESQWDAFAFMDLSGEHSGIVITRGSSNGALVADLISASSTVYVWTQNDAPG